MNVPRVDLASLSLFTLVARTGSISKGAGLANLAVGAASKRLSDLEATLGAELLKRSSRGVALTPAGQSLLQHAHRVLSDVDLLVADLSDYASGSLGVVRLWANISAVTQFLPGDLASFAAANPGIRIELEEQNSSEIVLALLDGRADLGIFADRTPALGLQVLPYREDRLAVVVPRGHPLARRRSVRLEDLVDYDFVSLPRATSLAKRMKTESEAMGRTLKLRIQVRSFDAVCLMVAAGMGVAVLPRNAVKAMVASLDLRLVTLAEPWAERHLLLGLRDVRAAAKPVRMLLEHLNPR
ncbi:LysR family transcriptional regulator [Geothrix sp. 21YS21S-2]|uniref:LysR family transcriptional regulator n=1 Tax=Geothrix sp. 21YS21S-2 TaxID=3068893 RepID=UPI0027BB20C5|nr:LysR family transcriptional regulator [Geothrix sp. 21YS21S-2]